MGIVVAFDFAGHGIYDAAKEAYCRSAFSKPVGYEGCSCVLAAQVSTNFETAQIRLPCFFDDSPFASEEGHQNLRNCY